MPKIYEYRGVEGLVAAPVLSDTNAAITYGDVIDIAGVSEISRSTDSTNESHYYDNMAAVVVSSTGADNISINTSAIPLDVLAKITGQTYNETLGAFIEQERTPQYWALGYRTKTTDGIEMFVWREKGMFNIPDSTHDTENDGTDANGQTLTYTGVSTIHKFNLTGKGAKAVTVDTSVNTISAADFFGTVQTPDTLSVEIHATGVGLAPSSITLDASEGETATLVATVYPENASNKTVTWASSDSTVASVADGVVTAKAEGSATITVTTADGSFTDTCAVTVTA